MTRVFLIGYRGVGKTTVAQCLANQLGLPWVDADALLEARAGKTIKSLFADEGEAGFRTRESALLQELCQGPDAVIATGGGVILKPENRTLLKRAGFVVWLQADAETLSARIAGDSTTLERRPNLTVGGLAEIRDLLALREPWYRECAQHTLSTLGVSAEEIAQAICQLLPRSE